MGNLIWHEYSRLLSISSSVYAIWASFWGIFYRKFFWDFIGGTLKNPGGLQPSPKVAVFIAVIVKVPIIQILTMVLAAIILCIELPLPLIKTLSLYRSLVLRIILLIFQASSALLFYQGTNAAIWSLISVICYGRAVALGERIQEAKEAKGNQGKREDAWFLECFQVSVLTFIGVVWWRISFQNWAGPSSKTQVFFNYLFFFFFFWISVVFSLWKLWIKCVSTRAQTVFAVTNNSTPLQLGAFAIKNIYTTNTDPSRLVYCRPSRVPYGT